MNKNILTMYIDDINIINNIYNILKKFNMKYNYYNDNNIIEYIDDIYNYDDINNYKDIEDIDVVINYLRFVR